MVIDSSAILAILLGEPEAELLARAIAADGRRLVSVVSVLESAIVIETRKGPGGAQALDQFLLRSRAETTAMNAEQLEIARGANSRFGKGRHTARLNLGDCCSYALARYSDEPLLFKGGDFAATDIAAVPVL
jgi:ribonuclease VapC